MVSEERLELVFSRDEERVYLGRDLEEFINAFSYHASKFNSAKLLAKKDEILAWLDGKCPKELMEQAIPFYGKSPEYFVMALRVLKERDENKYDLSRFAGYAGMKKWFSECLLPVCGAESEMRKKFGIRQKSGLLLYGPPGCGKSYLPHCLAGELKYCFVNVPPLLIEYPQEADRIPSYFEVARKLKRAILHFDDIDKLCESRAELRASATRLLLSEMDGHKIDDEYLLVGSTNYPERIDPAFFRPGRFDDVVYMRLPDLDSRKEIFRHCLVGIPTASLDFSELAEKTEFCSCADITHFCMQAALDCCRKSMKMGKEIAISQETLLGRISRQNPSAASWFEEKAKVDFGHFSELFSELVKDIEAYREKKGCSYAR